MPGRVEVIARVSGRWSWTVEQKLSMLRDAFGPGGSMREAKDRHEVSSGLLYTWRRNAMAGLLVDRASFAEVIVADPVPPPLLLPSSPSPMRAPEPASRIAIDLPSGIRLSVDAAFDAEALTRVVAVVGR